MWIATGWYIIRSFSHVIYNPQCYDVICVMCVWCMCVSGLLQGGILFFHCAMLSPGLSAAQLFVGDIYLNPGFIIITTAAHHTHCPVVCKCMYVCPCVCVYVSVLCICGVYLCCVCVCMCVCVVCVCKDCYMEVYYSFISLCYNWDSVLPSCVCVVCV